MIGAYVLSRAGRRGLYFSSVIVVAATILLISVLFGALLGALWGEILPAPLIPIAIVVLAFVRWNGR